MFILKESNREIGTLSAQQQFREAYLRAIYMHGGRSYRVTEVALTGSSGGEIVLESADPWVRTRASTFTILSEQDIFAGWRWVGDSTDVNAFYGKVLITESLNSVQEVNERERSWTNGPHRAILRSSATRMHSGCRNNGR